MEYKYVGNHAQDLADGRMLAPGETVELTDEEVRDPHYEDLLANDLLLPLDDQAEHEASLADRRVTSRTKKAEESAAPVVGEQVDDPAKEED